MSRRRGSGRTSRGELYPTLDLHGDTGAEAVLRSRRWLHEQRGSGSRTVQLVTGRGLRSPGPPVLRLEIEALLRSLQPELVAAFHSTAAGGAFIVELQPYRTTPSPQRPRLPWHDPDLQRLAEEALHELGIRPTPELIEAEIRRLRQRKTDEPA